MRIAQLPSDEEMRLADLSSYNILDTVAEKEFDELVELAAMICNCPISLISLIDKDRQWFKSKIGLEASETARDVAFCTHAILDDKVMMVENALEDERFHDNPLVTSDPNIRFYAGMPITSTNGYKLGTVCVIDREPKVLTDEQQRALTIISAQISKLFELRIKNKMIAERAEELIELKNKVIEQSVYEYEQSNFDIATQLHEGLAQELAAARFYIDMAKNGDTSYLDQAKEHMAHVLSGMRSITNAITPSTVELLSLEFLIATYIDKVAKELPFKVRFTSRINNGYHTTEQKIALYRVIESWLKMLKENNTACNVWIFLEINDTIRLSFSDDAPTMPVKMIKHEIMAGKIDCYIEKLNGVVDHENKAGIGNSLIVELPLMASAVPLNWN